MLILPSSPPAVLLVVLLLLCCRRAAAAAPLRLRVDGRRLLDPTTGADVALEGFNWQVGRLGPDPGALMKSLAPRANVAPLPAVPPDFAAALPPRSRCECAVSAPRCPTAP